MFSLWRTGKKNDRLDPNINSCIAHRTLARSAHCRLLHTADTHPVHRNYTHWTGRAGTHTLAFSSSPRATARTHRLLSIGRSTLGFFSPFLSSASCFFVLKMYTVCFVRVSVLHCRKPITRNDTFKNRTK